MKDVGIAAADVMTATLGGELLPQLARVSATIRAASAVVVLTVLPPGNAGLSTVLADRRGGKGNAERWMGQYVIPQLIACPAPGSPVKG
jgi:hypothetical protein